MQFGIQCETRVSADNRHHHAKFQVSLLSEHHSVMITQFEIRRLLGKPMEKLIAVMQFTTRLLITCPLAGVCLRILDYLASLPLEWKLIKFRFITRPRRQFAHASQIWKLVKSSRFLSCNPMLIKPLAIEVFRLPACTVYSKSPVVHNIELMACHDWNPIINLISCYEFSLLCMC